MEEINESYYRLRELCNHIQLTVSHIFYRTLDERWNEDGRQNDYTRLYFIIDGSGYLFNDTERIELVPGNIYVIPAGSRYNYRCRGYLEKIFLHFKMCVIPDRDILANLDRIITIPSDINEILYVKKMLSSESVEAAFFITGYIRSLSAMLVKDLTSAVEADMEIYKKYSRIYKYIEDNLYADTQVTDICRHIGFSQTYIGQKFRSDTGTTIKEYFSGRLTEKMKNMLRDNIPLRGIAQELHFSNESYASRFFKKHTGISPREYCGRYNG